MTDDQYGPLLEGVPDTGDLIDPQAPDPTGPEVVDQSDPNFVTPADDAVAPKLED